MLTVSQQKMVEDNEKLIYWALRKLKKPIEEYYGVAAIGLCNAVRKWDSEKSALSTFAFLCIRNEILMEYRKEKRQIRCASLDAPVLEEGNMTLGDIVPAPDEITRVEDRGILETAYKSLKTDQERKIMQMHVAGAKQKHIAKENNISQGYASRIIRKCQLRARQQISA